VYIPSQYREEERATMVAFMRAHPFALVITAAEGSPTATHLPLTVADEDGRLLIRGHFARANPHWQNMAGVESLVVFSGAHAYVSPVHYDRWESVPTWNYLAVHAAGPADVFDHEGGRERLERLLAELIEASEPGYRERWDSLDDGFRGGMIRGIVGFELEVVRLEGKAKLSQNKNLAEQRRVALALASSGPSEARALGAEMLRRLPEDERSV
jgi:transcriptional regulator